MISEFTVKLAYKTYALLIYVARNSPTLALLSIDVNARERRQRNYYSAFCVMCTLFWHLSFFIRFLPSWPIDTSVGLGELLGVTLSTCTSDCGSQI
jgi:hypothetical protein